MRKRIKHINLGWGRLRHRDRVGIVHMTGDVVTVLLLGVGKLFWGLFNPDQSSHASGFASNLSPFFLGGGSVCLLVLKL